MVFYNYKNTSKHTSQEVCSLLTLYCIILQCVTNRVISVKIMTFCMPETCENWHSLVISCVHYARLIRKFIRYYPTQWISKLQGSFCIHWVRHKFVNVVLFEMTVKGKNNLLTGAANIFPNFWRCRFDPYLPSLLLWQREHASNDPAFIRQA